ncbi:hypothetical protein ACGFZS_09630 [Streptomyces sp. NPDC048288]|uniref:hypothetical protein n=1 Tax=Streptomyces sp. NPDC048288 TaxID=3365529 RepID=UPI00371DEA17
MSAYTTAFQALTGGRALRPDEAARLLADLRTETGAELVTAAEKQLEHDPDFLRGPKDTEAEWRRKRRKYGAAMDAIGRLRRLASTSLPNVPHQRNNRSTS